MLLLIFKVGIQLRTPKSVIETHKIQKLDFFQMSTCPTFVQCTLSKEDTVIEYTRKISNRFAGTS